MKGWRDGGMQGWSERGGSEREEAQTEREGERVGERRENR